MQHALENINDLKGRRPQSLREWLFGGSPSRPGCGLGRIHENDNLTKEKKRMILELLPACENKEKVAAGVYIFPGGKGDMSLIVAPVPGGEDVVILIDGTNEADCLEAAWNAKLKHLNKITYIVVTHHDEDHTFGIVVLLWRYRIKQPTALPDLSKTVIYMNTRQHLLRKRNFVHEKSIQRSANELKITVKKLIFSPDSPNTIVDSDIIAAHVLLPTQHLLKQCEKFIPEDGKETKQVPFRGRTTATNVLSINLAVVWRKIHAYLFTGDAHLRDVTEAAERFMRDKQIKEFEYVDVPHHGSWKSNGENVEENMRGLARIPSKNYLLSSSGSTVTAKRATVIDILKSPKCKKLHFLYSERQKDKWKVPKCDQCETGPNKKTWKCCITDEDGKHIGKDLNKKIDTELNCFKFFPFPE